MKDPVNKDDDDDERRIMSMTWKRVENQHLTDGFREGALTGKDEHFQSSFDRGYEDGFQKSRDIGLKHGEQRASEFLNKVRKETKYCNSNQLHKELCSTCHETINSNKKYTN